MDIAQHQSPPARPWCGQLPRHGILVHRAHHQSNASGGHASCPKSEWSFRDLRGLAQFVQPCRRHNPWPRCRGIGGEMQVQQTQTCYLVPSTSMSIYTKKSTAYASWCLPTLLCTFRAAWNSLLCLISDSLMPSLLLGDTTSQSYVEFGVCTVRDSLKKVGAS